MYIGFVLLACVDADLSDACSVGCAYVMLYSQKFVLNLDGSKGAGVSAARPPAAAPLRRRSAAVPSAYGNWLVAMVTGMFCFVYFSFGSILDNVWEDYE